MVKYLRSIFLPAGMALILFYGCKKQDTTPTPDAPLYDNYFPLLKGSWRIYDADSAVYNGLTDSASYHNTFQIKEEVDGSFTDGSGNKVYRIATFIRPDEFSNWDAYKVYAAYKNNYEAVWTKENTSYVKMVFPVQNGQDWDADRYNTLDSLKINRARYFDVHAAKKIGINSFDSTLSVDVENVTDFVTRLYQQEVYAWDRGLALLHQDSLDIQRPNPQDTSVKKIRGFSYKQTLRSFGP